MNCEHFEDRMADYLAGAADAELERHFTECPGCRAEAERLRVLWRDLGVIAAGQPRPALRSRFYESLEAYRYGRERPEPRRPWRWFRLPAFQVAYAAALVALGVAVGHGLAAGKRSGAEIAQLQGEVRGMRQIVSLALLQQQSASDRLRGVDWGARMDTPDAQVLSALLQTLDHDSNVNVRLAAVDALGKFAGTPMVRGALDRSLVRQESPLVQVALIDLLVGLRATDAVPELRSVANAPAVNPAVRERALRGLEQLR